jgi:hypothetical protein
VNADGAAPPGKVASAFPDTLCHSCAAPPRYVTSDRGSVFIYCPIFKRYPPRAERGA